MIVEMDIINALCTWTVFDIDDKCQSNLTLSERKNFKSVSWYYIVKRSPEDSRWRKLRRFFSFPTYNVRNNFSALFMRRYVLYCVLWIIHITFIYIQWTWSISLLLTDGGTPLAAMQRYAPISDLVTFDKIKDSPSTDVTEMSEKKKRFME